MITVGATSERTVTYKMFVTPSSVIGAKPNTPGHAKIHTALSTHIATKRIIASMEEF